MSRENILIKTSWISTIGNAILSASKIIIGLWAGSLAVVGDGIDSATDVVISIVMIFTARLINRPPSKKYVFGYEKAEGIATKILSLVIFYAGMQMLISSIQSIFSDEVKEIPSAIAIYVTIFSIVGKLMLASYQYKQGKKIDSSMLTANAINMRNDFYFYIQIADTRFDNGIDNQPLYHQVVHRYFSRLECGAYGWREGCQCV